MFILVACEWGALMDFNQFLETALRLHQQGNPADAERLYLMLLQQHPEHADVLHLLGMARAMQGALEQGIADLQAAIRLNPQAPSYHNNLGQLLEQAGQRTAAILHLERALALDSGYFEAANNLGNLLFQNGDLQAAKRAYLNALSLSAPPERRAQLQINLARLCTQEGSFEPVVTLCAEVLAQLPNFLPALHLQLDAQLKRPDFFAAIETAEQIWQLEPLPENGLRLLSLLPPPIFQDADDLAYWRSRYQTLLDQLSGPLAWSGRPLRIDNTPFYLSYMGRNDRDLLTQLATIYRQILPEHPPQGPVKTQLSPHQKRIGFCSLHFYNHSVTHCFEGLIQACASQADFEVYLFSMERAQQDAHTERLRSGVKEFRVLPDDEAAARESIAAAELDILIYPDIGIDTFTWMLAFTRLAPVQMVLSGHPVTTGIPTLDYYLSSELLEGPEAQGHYSEKLVQLKHIPVNYSLPALPVPFKSRSEVFAELNLPEDQHLYLCPMMPFKFHTDLDALFAAILEGDPQGMIGIFDYPLAFFSEKLLPRLQAHLGSAFHRLKVLPWLPQPLFLNLLAHVDVALDTPHFGAGNTAYLSLGLGTPMVTLPSQYLRGRSTLALYQQMGMTDLIAQTPADYVQLALRLGQDRDFQLQMRQKITERSDLIFGRQDGILDLIEFLRNLC